MKMLGGFGRSISSQVGGVYFEKIEMIFGCLYIELLKFKKVIKNS